MVNVGIIGAGYWGKNLVRNFNTNKKVDKLLICDSNPEILKKTKTNFPHLQLFNDINEMLSYPLDGVVIATPPKLHALHAKKVLDKDLHLLVEKPLTTSLDDAMAIVRTAEKKNLTLMVDHTFLYNNIVEEVKRIVKSGELGEIHYIYSTRVNLGIIRQDVNVIWNLAPHDISIANYILDDLPSKVTANAHCFIQKELKIPDVAYINMMYDNDISVNIHDSWLNPSKRRDMVIVGSKKMLVYDDIHSDRHIQIFDKTIDRQVHEMNNFAEYRAVVRTGEMRIPNIKLKEPLAKLTEAFIDCIINNEKPATNGIHGANVIAILEAIDASIANKSAITRIKYPVLN